jgi:GT2 family glycosyltransferase
MMDCSIIIVNYNTREVLLSCLASIYATKSSDLTIEVIVVDNASQDGSVDAVRLQYPGVMLLPQVSNLGYSKANNLGIRSAKGRYVLLLNSDTVMQEGCLNTMLSFMDKNMEVGAAGCKVVLSDGSLDKACKRSFPTPINAFYHYLGLPKLFPRNHDFGAYNLTYVHEDEVHEVESLVGAFMLVKKNVIEAVGVLSEDYFMYGEDIDWCYRIKSAGWRIVYYPKTQILHLKGASSKKLKIKTTYHFFKSMIIFYNKFYSSKYNFVITLLTYMGVSVVFVFSIVKGLLSNISQWRVVNDKGEPKNT